MPPQQFQPRILHLITGCNNGGAETALERLVATTNHNFRHRIISLSGDGPMYTRYINCANDGCLPLGWDKGNTNSALGIARLAYEITSYRPHISMGWMYHGSLALTLGRLGALMQPPMIWAIRSGVSPHHRRSTTLVRKTLGLISSVPDRVVFVSKRSQQQHAPVGFRRARSVCIPNGYNVDRFRPDAVARDAIRREFDIPATCQVVAWVGRWHPDKAPHQAIAAFRVAAAQNPALHLVMAGTDCTLDGPAGSVMTGGDQTRIHLLGRRDDIPAILAAADVLLLSSHSEAFPNVIAEAMACGTPCVSTDVGDVTDIIGKTGIVVPVDDTAAMAAGLLHILAEPAVLRTQRSAAARQRICDCYSLPTIATRYDRLWREVIADRRRPT